MRVQPKTHLVPAATFVAGIIVSFAFNRALDQRIDSGPKLVTIVLGAVILYVAALTLVLYSSHQEVKATLESMNHQYGLHAEFFETESTEGEFLVYRKITGLVQDSINSLVFVEEWPPSGDTLSVDSPSYKVRKEYYSSIGQRIKYKAKNGEVFVFKRIVQIPKEDFRASVEASILRVEPIVSEHLTECLAIQKQSQKVTLKIAPSYIAANFIIIDDRVVVWSLYSFHSEDDSPNRYGVIIFTDHTGQFVQRLTAIYEMLDSYAVPLRGLTIMPIGMNPPTTIPLETKP